MILRLGSKGELVKSLQRFLKIVPDGDFGPRTDAAVKTWQANNNLRPDGIVGPKTWDAMGLATTDSSELIIDSGDLVIIPNFLPKGEYKVGPTKKEYVFLHHTAGWENPYNTITAWAKDNRGSVATEFVLGGQKITTGEDKHDGVLLQAFPEGGYGWHLGENGSQYMHTNSIGIEVCNFGWLKDGKTYVGGSAHPDQTVKLSKPFRGFTEWHRYSDKQIEILRRWILYIAERDSIDVRNGLPKWVKEKGAAGFEFNQDAFNGKVKGLLTHTNTRKDKFDMFPQQELMDMLVSL
jgi:hypothetical protein